VASTSSKLSGKKSKKAGKFGNGQLLSGCGFVQNVTPPSLSRARRIKVEKTNNKQFLDTSVKILYKTSKTFSI